MGFPGSSEGSGRDGARPSRGVPRFWPLPLFSMASARWREQSASRRCQRSTPRLWLAPLRNTTNYTKSAAPESSATAMLPIHAVRPTLRPEHMKRHYQTCRQRHPASHRASLFSSQTLTLNHAYHFRDFSCRHKAFRVWRRGEVRRTAAKVSSGRRRRNRTRNRRRRLPQGNPPRRQLSCPARSAVKVQTAQSRPADMLQS